MPASRPVIAFLDAQTLDLGDLDMRPLSRLGRYLAIPKCSRGKIPPKARGAEIVVTNKVFLGKRELKNLPKLRLIAVSATGVNNIDLEAAQAAGVGVCNVAGYSTQTVVEHTLMFLLSCAHRLPAHDRAVKSGRWSRSPIFTLLDYPFTDLEGKTLGIIGHGTIGKKVARLARAFSMKILVGKIPGRRYPKSKDRVGLKELLKRSDFVSLHCALTPQTRGLINRERLALMKPGAYLLNLARGPVVVEAHVAQALERGRLSGYAADVTEQEPIPKAHPFLKKSLQDKVLLTPHVAWASRESRQRLVDEIGKNIEAFLKGRKRNRLV